MSLFTKLGNEIASPIDAAGNPRAVENVDMQRWMTEVERAMLSFQAGGGIIFPDKATMDGTLTYAANQMAWVMGDATAGNNGIYRKVGASGSGSWVRLGDLPFSFIMATNAGAGTPDAIVATSSLPVPAADGAALISLNITTDNTGSPVTVTFNGGPVLTIKTMSGNDVAPSGLRAGMIVTGFKAGSTFRMITDQASAAIQAAAEAAQAAAEAAAAAAGGTPPVADRTALKALDTSTKKAALIYGEGGRNGTFIFVPDDLSALVAVDPLEGIYIAPDSDSTGTSGAWVRQFSGSVDARWFGAAGDGTTDCAPAIQAAIDLFESLSQGATIALPRGSVRMLSGVTSEGAGIFIRGEGREATIVRPEGSFDVFTFVSAHRGWGVYDFSVKYAVRPTSNSLVLQANFALSGLVRNIYCQNIANGFSIGNAQATSIENIEMWNFAGNAIHFSGSLNDVFMQNIFLNGENNPSCTGWRVTGKAHAMLVSNVEIILCKVPALWEGQDASINTIAFSRLFNCFFDSSAAPASFRYLRDVEFHGCWWSQRETGASFDDSKIVKFFGGGAVNCDKHGFILQDGCVDFEFHGFTADSNSRSASNSYTGVVVAGASHVRFFGGYYGNGGVFPARQSNGIQFVGSNDNYLIQGARFEGNLALPIAGHTPSSTKRVRDCIGVVTENGGTSEVSLTDGEATIAHGLSYTPRTVTLQVVNGGAAEATLKSVNSTNITVRIRNTTTNENSTGSWLVNWSATA